MGFFGRRGGLFVFLILFNHIAGVGQTLVCPSPSCYGRTKVCPAIVALFGRPFLDLLRRAGAPAGEDVAERLVLPQIDLPLLDQLEEGEESDDQLALRA